MYSPPQINHLYSLDVLRGLAALSVVFYHWDHFFYTGTTPGIYNPALLPFYGWASILYNNGWMAVDLFFCISGFVFYWLYSEKIFQGKLELSKFALLRLSRLYPLYFATLIIVAIFQLYLMRTQGSSFVYGNNDLRHFILNLFMASSWGLEQGLSYNGPGWSISVEVMLYLIFFICCRFISLRFTVLAAIAVSGFIAVKIFDAPIARGISSFFLGGIVYLIYRGIMKSPHSFAITWSIAIVMISAWTLTYIISMEYFSLLDLNAYFSTQDAQLSWIITKFIHLWPTLILFPATILALTLLESHIGPFGKRLSILGDISYSTYMIHFPLQILIWVLISRLSISIEIYYSLWFMLAFFSVLILVSTLSFRKFELRIQNILRGKSIKIISN